MKRILILIAIVLLMCGTAFAESVTLKWDANTDPIDGYIVYESLVSGSGYVQIDVVPCTANDPVCSEYTTGQLDWETAYYWVVTAFRSPFGQSGYSNEATHTTPSEPLDPPPRDPTGCFIKAVNP